MLIGKVRLFDYRCFVREEPATLELRNGFTSFVGPNNSGKSALIKALYEIRGALAELNQIKNGKFNVPFRSGWNIRSPLHEHAEIMTDRSDPECVVEIVLSGVDSDQCVNKFRLEFDHSNVVFGLRMFFKDGRELFPPRPGESYVADDFHDFTGVGRSIKLIFEFVDKLTGIQYFGPYRNAINEGAGDHFGIQIGTGFINQWHYWKTGPIKLQNRAIGRVTEDVRRLVGAKTLEINASTELKTLQVVVNGRPHRLQELGAGFSQLVLVLGNALIQKPSFIMIDEPELHLHPSLQYDFLTTLATYANHGVIYATHSMGLARLADHCYSVQKKDDRSLVKPFARTSNYTEFLGSLGIAGLQDIGWNTVLLVEGPKDVRTLQQILRIYKKDRYVLIIPLGGDSMINGIAGHELVEIRRICDRVYAIIDSERKSENEHPKKAHQDFKGQCDNLGIKCHLTQRRAIENYVNQRSLDEVWGKDKYTALAPYAMPAKDGAFWGKGESWKAAARMSLEELDATDIGAFLREL
ncbi:MAG: hypothetical protein RLY71_1946 [Pseudomonadota bacterium]|jgi:ABC-type cobalamin/Fe3+-siderophores transport system ATPase subunit